MVRGAAMAAYSQESFDIRICPVDSDEVSKSKLNIPILSNVWRESQHCSCGIDWILTLTKVAGRNMMVTTVMVFMISESLRASAASLEVAAD